MAEGKTRNYNTMIKVLQSQCWNPSFHTQLCTLISIVISFQITLNHGYGSFKIALAAQWEIIGFQWGSLHV